MKETKTMGKKGTLNKRVGDTFSDREKVSLSELFASFMNTLMEEDRKRFLQTARLAGNQDRANGFYNRFLPSAYGIAELAVPRTRSGAFRPYILPEKWKRIPQEIENLVLAALASGVNRRQIGETLKSIGIPVSEQIIDQFEQDCMEYFKWLNESALPESAVQLIMDAKQVEVKCEDKISLVTVYLAALVDFDYKRRVCGCMITFSKENERDWVTFLAKLVNRGLKRVLVITSDAFAGIQNATNAIYRSSLHQFCWAHLKRNVMRNMEKKDARAFSVDLEQVKHAVDYQSATAVFESLLKKYNTKYSNFIDSLKKHQEQYLAFTKFPYSVRKYIYTSNLAEGVNNAIERKRKDVAGYFRSVDHLKIALTLVAKHLHSGKWCKPHPHFKACDYELRQMFFLIYGVEP